MSPDYEQLPELPPTLLLPSPSSVPSLDVSSPVTPMGRTEILQLLDFEIEEARLNERQHGWNLWALYGAFCTFVWLLLEELGNFDLNTTRIAALILVLLVTVFVCELLRGIIMPFTRTPLILTPRLQLDLMPSQRPAGFFVFLFRLGVVLTCLFLARPAFNCGTFVAVCIFVGALCLVPAAVVVLNIWGPPFTKADQYKGKFAKIGLVIFIMLYLVFPSAILGSLGFFAWMTQLSPSIHDAKTALICLGIYFIVSEILSLWLASPHLYYLVQVKSEYLLGTIQPSDVLRHVETLATGAKVKDLVDREETAMVDWVKRQRTPLEIEVEFLRQIEEQLRGLPNPSQNPGTIVIWEKFRKAIPRIQKANAELLAFFRDQSLAEAITRIRSIRRWEMADAETDQRIKRRLSWLQAEYKSLFDLQRTFIESYQRTENLFKEAFKGRAGQE